LPSKNAGVGWARKIGMDMAVSHFNQTDNKSGIIISLDADTVVESNYLISINEFYNSNPDYIAAVIYFEHPLNEERTNDAIIMYELYMRYYKNAVTVSGFPNSIFSVGSCFSVLAKAYVSQGGMNREKSRRRFLFP
jgi:glycosyltransferase involved in cell wall biosynthesis